MLTNKFLFFKLNFFSMLNSFTQYKSQGPGFVAIGHFFSSVVGQRKGRSGATVHGIKKCLGIHYITF
jgi:hypothetical protein